jgi:hypothetical protein
MDNLFCNLFRWAHRQDENFLTECLAFLIRYLLQKEPATGLRFLGWLCCDDERSHQFDPHTTVTTQVTTEAGRPDVRIESSQALCLVEVKKESPLGEHQLERYRSVLNRSSRGVKWLVLLTVHAVHFEEDAEKPERHVRWSDVASWLRRQELSDTVSRFLVEQFLDFIKSEVTTVEQISWEYLNGVRALRNLVGMIGRGLELGNIPIHQQSSAADRIGYYIDRKQFWAGVWYEYPQLVCFSFWDARVDLEKFRSLGRGKLNSKGQPYFDLDLSSEATHFFARSAESQLALLKAFLGDAYRDSKGMVAMPMT